MAAVAARSVVMPGVCAMASSSDVMFWSSMRWRVMTDTDCGISRSDSGSLPPMVTLGAV